MATRPLNNVTTADTYSDANTCIMSPPMEEPSMVVTGAAIYYQLQPFTGLRGDSGQWGPETFAIPGRYSFGPGDFFPGGKCSGIRVRSAVSATPAQVTIA